MQTFIPIALILAVLPVASMAQEVKVGRDRYAIALGRADLRRTRRRWRGGR